MQSTFGFGHEFFRWFFFPTIEFFRFSLRFATTALTFCIFLLLQFTCGTRLFQRCLRLRGVLTCFFEGFVFAFFRCFRRRFAWSRWCWFGLIRCAWLRYLFNSWLRWRCRFRHRLLCNHVIHNLNCRWCSDRFVVLFRFCWRIFLFLLRLTCLGICFLTR